MYNQANNSVPGYPGSNYNNAPGSKYNNAPGSNYNKAPNSNSNIVSRSRPVTRNSKDTKPTGRTTSPPPCNFCHCKRNTCAMVWCFISLLVTAVVCWPYVMTILIEKKRANKTALGIVKSVIPLEFLDKIPDLTKNASNHQYCWLIDHPTFNAAAIRLGGHLLHALGIIFFLLATIIPNPKLRICMVRVYRSCLYAPLLAIPGLIYFKVSDCFKVVIYWASMLGSMALNYAWTIFGDEIAKTFISWVEDPEAAEKLDDERFGRTVAKDSEDKKNRSKQQISRPPPPPTNSVQSDTDIESFIRRKSMGTPRPLPTPPPGYQRSQPIPRR